MPFIVGHDAVTHNDRRSRNDKIEIVYHGSLASNFSLDGAEGLHDGATDIDDGEKFTQAVYLGQVVGKPVPIFERVNQLSVSDDGYGFRILVMDSKIFNDGWIPLQRVDQYIGIKQKHQNTTSGLSTGCLDLRISETISSASLESSNCRRSRENEPWLPDIQRRRRKIGPEDENHLLTDGPVFHDCPFAERFIELVVNGSDL